MLHGAPNCIRTALAMPSVEIPLFQRTSSETVDLDSNWNLVEHNTVLWLVHIERALSCEDTTASRGTQSSIEHVSEATRVERDLTMMQLGKHAIQRRVLRRASSEM